MKIVEEYEKILDILNHVSNINRGGCGFVAYRLSISLTKRNIPHTLVFMGSSEKELKQLTRMPDHVVVRVGKHYYDTNGKTEAYWYKFEKERLIEGNKKDLLTLLRGGIWNPKFNKRHVSFINKMFSGLEKPNK